MSHDPTSQRPAVPADEGRRCALITGISGQDGSYLAEHLLALGYDVHGLVRPHTSGRPLSSYLATGPLAHLAPHLSGADPDITLWAIDLRDSEALRRVIDEVRPEEIYNLAGQSSVGRSFSEPLATADSTGLGVVRLLDAVREAAPTARVYQAGSSEMFGAAPAPQSETTPFHPRSPYGAAKVYAHWATVNYRESYGLFACNGILFNHDSPRRPETFVTRKITAGTARIARGEQKVLRLGNLDVRRDWGHAREYVTAMHAMLQAAEPVDLVIGTGTSHRLEHFLELAFQTVDLDWHDHVEFDEALLRPADVADVCADPALAAEQIGWNARITLPELVTEMVQADLARCDAQTDDRC